MSFRITGLSPEPFIHLYGMDDATLRAQGVEPCIADSAPGYPDRITLCDAQPGQRVLLLNFVHQPADNPYRASHAIFVLEGATRAHDAVDRVPQALRVRPLSLRAFDRDDRMVDADIVDGIALEGLIERLLGQPRVAYAHAHYARRGCYAALITRA
jgi:hypothetical protein